MKRIIHCRECGKVHEGNYHFSELPVPCSHCGSTDTYSEVGQVPVKLRQGGVGWAINGYTNDGYRHYDLGKPTDSKRKRWGKVKN
jgi:hypothetical protein